MLNRSVSLALALLCAAMPALAASSADEARVWIDRMNKAVVERSYDGVLEHSWTGGGPEILRVIHRKQGGVLTERVMFYGSKFEIIRNGTKYVELDRRKGIAKAQTLTRSYGYLSAFNGVSAESDKLYYITKGGVLRLPDYAGQTQLITVMPKDGLRYGYRFWLDLQTAMPIQTQLLTASGVVIDTITFVSLVLPDAIPDELLKPTLDPMQAKALRWVKPDASSTVVRQTFLPLASLLPPGFRVLKFDSSDAKVPASEPETRFIVSDGVSWVSVLISVADRPAKEGLRRESPSAFSYLLKLDDHYVSVRGEVPPATVAAIARAVRPE